MAALRILKLGLLCSLGGWSVMVEATGFSFGAHIDRYIRSAAERYQVSEKMLRGLVKMEDGWYGKVSPTGPIGVGQFTENTWNWLAETPRGRALGMKLVTSRNRGTYADPRRNAYLNTQATALLARWHIEQFQERGIRASDENLYMAHNIGLDGFHRALQGRATRDDISNMRKNGMKRWMTVNDFIRYQQGRYLTHRHQANSPSQTYYATQPAVSQPRGEQSSNSIATVQHTGGARVAEPVATTTEQIVMRGSSPRQLNWIQPTNSRIFWVNPQ